MKQIDDTSSTPERSALDLQSLPSTTSLVLDMLTAEPGTAMSVSRLCRGGEIMGYLPAATRVAITRLARQGKITRRNRGEYALNTAGHHLQLAVSGWRARMDTIVPWSGMWIGVQDGGVSRTDRASARKHDLALNLSGFRRWRPGLSLRPDNLAGGVATLRSELNSLGLMAQAEIFSIGSLSEKQDRSVLALWNRDQLLVSYELKLALLNDSLVRLQDALSGAECISRNSQAAGGFQTGAKDAQVTAARESLLTGRALIADVLRDPRLPEELAPTAPRRAMTAALAEYQLCARRLWTWLLNGM